MNLTRPEPFVGFEGTEAVSGARVPSELQRVSYVLVDPANRAAAGKDLIRAVTRNLLPATAEEEPAQQWLMGGVQGVTFYYYDGTQWRDSWDSTAADPTTGLTNNLPQA